jgi:hypothetical protein
VAIPDWHHQANQANLMLEANQREPQGSRSVARTAIRLVFKYPHC